MNNDNELKGLGGWLVLVGIGVVISPIRMLVTIPPIYLPLFQDGTWEVLTTVGSEAYIPYFGALLVGEIVINLIMLIASLLLIYLFFSKHYLFPKLFIGILLFTLIFILLDAWLVTVILPGEKMFDPETTMEFLRTLIPSVIWIPYMLISKRVQATFVENMPDN